MVKGAAAPPVEEQEPEPDQEEQEEEEEEEGERAAISHLRFSDWTPPPPPLASSSFFPLHFFFFFFLNCTEEPSGPESRDRETRARCPVCLSMHGLS